MERRIYPVPEWQGEVSYLVKPSFWTKIKNIRKIGINLPNALEVLAEDIRRLEFIKTVGNTISDKGYSMYMKCFPENHIGLKEDAKIKRLIKESGFK